MGAHGGPLRRPDTTRANLQARVRARRLLKVDADFYVDALYSNDVKSPHARAGLEARN